MILFRGVDFHYGQRKILDGVSVHLPAGSFQFLTGPSGAGKTTLMRMCYLDLMPDGGQVSILGLEAPEASRDQIAQTRRRIGIVNQDCQFVDHLSVFENVGLPLMVAGLDINQYHENIKELLDWVGLTPFMKARPAELSGGEKQRAALARAVIMSPDIILADEPTGNVDWEMGQRILQLLIELNRLGKTVLIATHDLNMIRAAKGKVSTRTLRLTGGALDIAGAAL